MWNPKTISSEKGSLDFSSSDQGIVEATKIYLDNWLFCNSVERLEVEESSEIQFYVCTHCGYAGCEPGNWLALRRCGDYAFLVPAFEYMEEGERELSEYAAPHEIRKNGAVYLKEKQYRELRKIVSLLPELKSLPRLSKREVSLLLQWEAPYGVLGQFPNKPEFDLQRFLVTESERGDGIVSTLNSALQGCLISKESATCVIEIKTNSTIFLDVSEHIEWNPISEISGQLFLRLEPCFGFET